MKQIRFFLVTIFLGLAFLSCQPEEDNNGNSGNNGNNGNSGKSPVHVAMGTIKLVSTSTNPYKIYINGEYKGVIEGKKSNSWKVESEMYAVRVVQQSGYLLYPTDETYHIAVLDGYVHTKYFPESKGE